MQITRTPALLIFGTPGLKNCWHGWGLKPHILVLSQVTMTSQLWQPLIKRNFGIKLSIGLLSVKNAYP